MPGGAFTPNRLRSTPSAIVFTRAPPAAVLAQPSPPRCPRRLDATGASVTPSAILSPVRFQRPGSGAVVAPCALWGQAAPPAPKIAATSLVINRGVAQW